MPSHRISILMSLSVLPAAVQSQIPEWSARPDSQSSQIALDTAVAHGGHASARLSGLSAEDLRVLLQTIRPDSFRGHRVRLTAWVQSDLSSGWAGLWMRMDSETPGEILAFDNMSTRPITTRTPWTRYEVILDVPATTGAIVLGVLLTGQGNAWVDNFSLEPFGPEVSSTDMLAGKPQVQAVPDSVKERMLGARKAAGFRLRNPDFEQRP
ncbi:MAG: hypothetical protein ACT4PM_07135 [Gemmatimonadales bacterium]